MSDQLYFNWYCVDDRSKDRRARKNARMREYMRKRMASLSDAERLAHHEKKRADYAAKMSDPEYRAKRSALERKNYRARMSTEDGKRKLYTYQRRRIYSSPSVKILIRTRSRIAFVLKNCIKSKKTTELIGISIDGYRAYLKSKWLPGMSWENYGQKGWHIDHIRPCASFDFTDQEQQRQCFHYTNTQPLWAKDNLSKGDKWPLQETT